MKFYVIDEESVIRTIEKGKDEIGRTYISLPDEPEVLFRVDGEGYIVGEYTKYASRRTLEKVIGLVK